jgi:hypothetical protein
VKDAYCCCCAVLCCAVQASVYDLYDLAFLIERKHTEIWMLTVAAVLCCVVLCCAGECL